MIDEDFPRDATYALARDPGALTVRITVDEAGRSRLQMAYLTVGEDEVRNAMRLVQD